MWTFGKSFFWNNNTFTVICYSVKKTIEVNFSFFIEHTHTHTNKKPLLVVSGQPSLLRLLPDSGCIVGLRSEVRGLLWR